MENKCIFYDTLMCNEFTMDNLGIVGLNIGQWPFHWQRDHIEYIQLWFVQMSENENK